jgi:hypothetical protein
MASTPMDLDRPSGTTPAAPYLNIHRTIPSGTSSTSNLSDVISTFRPTKVRNPSRFDNTLFLNVEADQ